MSEPTPEPPKVPNLTAEEIAALKRRSQPPYRFFTHEQVMSHLRALQAEWDRTGDFDQATMTEFLARLADREPAHYRTADGKWVTFMPADGTDPE